MRKFETFVFNTNSIIEAFNEIKLLKGDVAAKLNQLKISQSNKEDLPLDLHEALNGIRHSTGQINALITTIKERAAITIPLLVHPNSTIHSLDDLTSNLSEINSEGIHLEHRLELLLMSVPDGN